LKKFFKITLLIIIAAVSFAQQRDSIEFLPAGLNFMPLKANHQEARLGILYYTATTNLKVDIGNTSDLIAFYLDNGNIKLTAGIDFMAYAWSTSYSSNRLQIDALDGFFGGNVSFSEKTENGRLLGRFRIVHNSAHLVDGHYDRTTSDWIDDKEPIPFTRDTGELTAAHEIVYNWCALKYYCTIAYSTLVRPADLKKFGANCGIEFALSDLFGKILDKDINLYFAHHFSLVGVPEYLGNNRSMLGVKFGDWDGKGISIYLSWFKGNNIFSEYYKDRVNKFGIGFFVDFN
jgi:hypothetical protein